MDRQDMQTTEDVQPATADSQLFLDQTSVVQPDTVRPGIAAQPGHAQCTCRGKRTIRHLTDDQRIWFRTYLFLGFLQGLSGMPIPTPLLHAAALRGAGHSRPGSVHLPRPPAHLFAGCAGAPSGWHLDQPVTGCTSAYGASHARWSATSVFQDSAL